MRKKIPVYEENKIIRRRKRIVGRWCNEIEGRLPYPIECSTFQYLSHPNCVDCTRCIEYRKWKDGRYATISAEIMEGVNYAQA